MKFLVLLCALVPLCASDLVLDSDGWLIEDFHDSIFDTIRVRRQAPQGQHQQPAQPQYRPYSQAPSQIKQLLQFQQAREPLVHIPAPPPPSFGPARSADPQVQTQTQATGYRPQVQYGNAPQQPTYNNQAAAVAVQYRPQSQPQGQSQHNQGQYQPQGQQPQYNQGQQPQYNQGQQYQG